MTDVRIAPSHTFAVVEAHARDFVNRSASDCDMRHEVTNCKQALRSYPRKHT